MDSLSSPEVARKEAAIRVEEVRDPLPAGLGFGTHCLPADSSTVEIVKKVLQLGCRHIDTAQSYKNETQVGQGIVESGVPRSKLYVTTKLSPKHMISTTSVEEALERSLKNLGPVIEGYVDCFMVHWPAVAKLAPDAPEQKEKRNQVWMKLAELKTKGKIKCLAVSNFLPHHLSALPEPKPAFNQLELHPWCHQRETVEYCREHGIGIQAYSPLGRGDPDLLNHPLFVKAEIKGQFGQVIQKLNIGMSDGEGALEEGSSSTSGAVKVMLLNFSQGYDSYLLRTTKLEHFLEVWALYMAIQMQTCSDRPKEETNTTEDTAQDRGTNGRQKRSRSATSEVGTRSFLPEMQSSSTRPLLECLEGVGEKIYNSRPPFVGEEEEQTQEQRVVEDKHYCWSSSVVKY